MASFWQHLAREQKPFLVMAPMDGVTDYVFREIIAEVAKPDVLFTEFTNTEALVSRGYEKTIRRLKYSECERPIIAQIWGTEPKNFYTAARMIRQLGFDGVDINMGCPDRAVMKTGSGASLINTPGLAAEIIAATKEGAAGLAVSVKTRIGVVHAVTQEWVSFLLAQHLDALTVHGRTAKELSKVPAHWDEIGKAVRLRGQVAPETVIIGNGDILSVNEARRAAADYGVDGVMIGEGVLHNPWVFERKPKSHTSRESLGLLLKHTRLYAETYGEGRPSTAMRKYFKIYVRSFPGANALLKQLMETTNVSEVERLVKPWMGY